MAHIVTVGSFIKASKNKFFKIWILASLSKGYEFNFQWLSQPRQQGTFPLPLHALLPHLSLALSPRDFDQENSSVSESPV